MTCQRRVEARSIAARWLFYPRLGDCVMEYPAGYCTILAVLIVRQIDVSSNQLNGTIPSNISALTGLAYV